ncbi:hypothetical protein Tdes44962_MAKER03567 [Teratosphaeria destructans]|uniref:Uncharacterized protein n=1 Tax=Teratosphaeria destructans TaxID=418781 RepID=A0A9W7SPK6_9PEZI|nr:hypothetical protein Tdes44962_MAKER03567 [Teratosphaeria destructans]
MEDSDPELTSRRAMKQLPAMLSSLGIHVPGGLLPDTASSIYTEVGPDDRHYNRSDYAANNDDGQRHSSHCWSHHQSRPLSHQQLSRKNSWEDSRPSSRDRSPALGKPVRGSTLAQTQLRQDLAQVKKKLSGISDQLFELQRKKTALEAEQELWQRHRIMIEEQLL